MGNTNGAAPPGGYGAPPGGGDPFGRGYGSNPDAPAGSPAYGSPPVSYGPAPSPGHGTPRPGTPLPPASYGAPANGYTPPPPTASAFGQPAPYHMPPPPKFAIPARGSFGLGVAIGLFGGCIGLGLVHWLSRAPDTKKGAMVGFGVFLALSAVSQLIRAFTE